MDRLKRDLITIAKGKKLPTAKLQELERDGYVHLSETLPPQLTGKGHAEIN